MITLAIVIKQLQNLLEREKYKRRGEEMNEEKVKIVLEIRNFIYGTEMKVVSVEPEPREISEEFKDKIWDDYGIDVDSI